MKKYWWITYLQHQGKRKYLLGVKKRDWFCTLRFSACASCTEDIPNPFPLQQQQQQQTLLLLHCTQEALQNIILPYPIARKKLLHSSNPTTTSCASLKPPCSSSSSLRRKTRKIKIPFLWRDLDDSKQLKIPGIEERKVERFIYMT